MDERYVLDGDRTQLMLSRGARTMTSLLRPTLGPLARTVAISGALAVESPEVLDSGAIIARRTIQLCDPFEDMGAMIIRNLAWAQFDEFGDGSVTACLIAQTLIDDVLPYLAAGGDPKKVAQIWKISLPNVFHALHAQVTAISSTQELHAVISGVLREPDLSEMLTDVMDAVGIYGHVTIEDSASTESGYHFLEGVSWQEGWTSSAFARDGDRTLVLDEPSVFISAQGLETAAEALPVLEACIETGEKRLLVIAPHVGDAALNLLLLNRERGVLQDVGAVRAPLTGIHQQQVMNDIAVITGGKYVNRAAWANGDTVRPEDLGHARSARITSRDFTILGGSGKKPEIRRQLQSVMGVLRNNPNGDPEELDVQRARLGRLEGVAAIVRIGAATKIAQSEKRVRVEAAVRSARSALKDGIVPGGGSALARSAESSPELGSTGAEIVARRSLARALCEPMRSLSENAGLYGAIIVAGARTQPAGWTYDVRDQTWVDARTHGILDSYPALVSAIQKGVSSATGLLTTNALIRRRSPEVAAEP
jgi:chaperonin GroEL